MTGRLPPLAALRAFEAVGRLSSFAAAAAELGVTPTAVSHQIRQLEDHLGMKVFERTPRGAVLTAESRDLFSAATEGLSGIGRAVARLTRKDGPTVLTLTSSAAFLSHWLVPRLGVLREVIPELDLRLHASNTTVDLEAGGIDLAIRYGRGPYAEAHASILTADAFAPVCSPTLGVVTRQDLDGATLIHVDGRTRPSPPPDWNRWRRLVGMNPIDVAGGLRLPDSLLATQAAIAGQGVAILSLVLVADALRNGLLVRPFEATLPGDAYHFVRARNLPTSASVESLELWFRRELGSARGVGGQS